MEGRRTRGRKINISVLTQSAVDSISSDSSSDDDNDLGRDSPGVSADEGAEYDESKQRSERAKLKRARQVLAKQVAAPPTYSNIFTLCNKGEGHVSIDCIHALTMYDIICLLFEVSGFPMNMFDKEEVEEYEPSFLIESSVSRCDEMNIDVSPMSPVLIPLLRRLAKNRALTLEKLKKSVEYSTSCGVAPLFPFNLDSLSGVSTEGHLGDVVESFNLVSKNSKFKLFDHIRDGLKDLFIKMLTSSDDADILQHKLPPLWRWLQAMCESSVRPIRHTGVFLIGCVARGLAARMSEMSARFRVLVSQIPISNKIAELTRSLKDTMSSSIKIAAFLQKDVQEILVVRHRDISWHIQHEVMTILSDLTLMSPFFWVLGADSIYPQFWLSLVSHENAEIRLLCFDSLERVFNNLDSRFTNDETVDSQFDFLIKAEPSTLIIRTALQDEIRVLDNFRPPTQSIPYRVQEFMHRVFSKVLVHVQDSDYRVSVAAAECLALIGSFENTWSSKHQLSLSDEAVTRAVALLFSSEFPLAQIQVAKFVNIAIFQISIINENEVQAILNFSTKSNLPSLTADRVMSMSVELNTFIEFLRDFANTPAWQSRHIQAIKAFWQLTPFLHYWDLLLDHLCVAFNHTAVVEENSRKSIAASWVRPESTASLLSVLLGLIEIDRVALGCPNRYYTLPKFQCVEDELDPEERYKLLSEIACGGYRVPNGETEDLWNFRVFQESDLHSVYRVQRLARRFQQLWRVITYLAEGSKSSPNLYSTCLCIVYELLTGTIAMVFTDALQFVESELNLKVIMQNFQKIVEIVLLNLSTLTDRSSLQASYSILKRVPHKHQFARGTLTESAQHVVSCMSSIEEKIEAFFGTYRLDLLKATGHCARQVAELTVDDMESASITASYRSKLILLTALIENDNCNTFRDCIETLDDLIGIVELKVNCMNPQFFLKGSPLEPSDHLTTLTFDLIWIGLAKWMEQIEVRFIGYILPEMENLLGEKLGAGNAGADLASRIELGDQAAANVKKLEDRLRLLKEDLDIFRELLHQLLGFAAKYCEGLRGRLQRPAPELICVEGSSIYSGGPDNARIQEERAIHRKSMLLAALCIVRLIINANFFHTLPRLWLLIEQGTQKICQMRVVWQGSNKILQLSRDVNELCQACRDPPRSESSHEVAFFVDQLRQMAAPHRRTLAKAKLEATFTLHELSYGLLSSFGSATPCATGPVAVWDVYRNSVSEEAVISVCQSLPTLAEIAYVSHIQLMATICHVPDPGLWKEASVGAVILTGLNSNNQVLQSMAKIFLNRLKDYDAIRKSEIDKLASNVAAANSQIVRNLFDNETEPTMLCQILCGVIAQLLDRIQNSSSNRSLEEAELVASNAAAHLYPQYFIDLTNDEFNKFVWHVIRLSWVEPATPTVDGLFLNIISQHLLRGKMIRRRWSISESTNCVAQIRANFAAYFDQLDKSQFSQDYFDALEKLFRVCYPLPKKQTHVIEREEVETRTSQTESSAASSASRTWL